MSMLRRLAPSRRLSPSAALVLAISLITVVVALGATGVSERAQSASAQLAAGVARMDEVGGVRDALWGPARAVAMDAARVYVGAGRRVVVVEYDEAGATEIVGRGPLLPGRIEDLVVDGSWLFASMGGAGRGASGLAVLAVGAEGDVQLVTHRPVAGEPGRLARYGTHLLVACGSAGLRVFDVTEPAALRPVAAPGVETTGSVTDLAIAGDVALLAGDRVTQLALDAAEGGPRVTNALEQPMRSVAIADSGRAYGLDGAQANVLWRLQLDALERSSEASLEIPEWQFAFSLEGLHVAGDLLLARLHDSDLGVGDGVVLIDPQVSDFRALHTILPTGAAASALATHQQRAAVVSPSGLALLDLEGEGRMRYASSIERADSGSSILPRFALSPDGAALYVADEVAFSSFDLSDPRAPLETARIAMNGAYPDGMRVVDDRLYLSLSDRTDVLHIYDVRDAPSPRLLGRLPTLPWSFGIGTASALTVADDFLYFLTEDDREHTLHVTDVIDPHVPARAGTLPLGVDLGLSPGLLAVDDTVFVVGGRVKDAPARLYAVDAANKNRPQVIGAVDLPAITDLMLVAGPSLDYRDGLVLVGGDGSLAALDVREPESMQVVGIWQYGPPGDGEVWFEGMTAFLATFSGVVGADLSDAQRPRAFEAVPIAPMVDRGPHLLRGSRSVLALRGEYDDVIHLVDRGSTAPHPKTSTLDGRLASPSQVGLRDGRVLVLGGDALRALSLVPDERPSLRPLGRAEPATRVTDIAFVGDQTWAAAGDHGLLRVEVGRRERSWIVGRQPLTGRFGAMDLSGLQADGSRLLAWGGEGLRLLDLSDGDAIAIGPRQDAVRFGATGSLSAADIVDGQLAVAFGRWDGPHWLARAALDDAGALVGTPVSTTLTSLPAAVRVVGSATYIVGEDRGLQVVDIAGGRVGRAVAGVPMLGATSMALRGDRLWVAGGDEAGGWVRVLDVGDPWAPRPVGRHETTGRIEDIAVDPVTGAVVAVDAIDGLILLDAPAAPLRAGAYLPVLGEVGAARSGDRPLR